MRDNVAFNEAVDRLLVALREGENVDGVWDELLDEGELNDADLRRALQRAETLEAEVEGWDD
jgi:hypothetical protein